MKIKYWCDSGANIHSCVKGEVELNDLGVSAAEWSAMSSDEQEELMKPICLEKLDWGFEVIEC